MGKNLKVFYMMVFFFKCEYAFCQRSSSGLKPHEPARSGGSGDSNMVAPLTKGNPSDTLSEKGFREGKILSSLRNGPNKDSLSNKQKPIKLHGAVSVTGQMSDNTYTGQTVPLNYVRTQVDVQVELFGAPVNVGYYYTSENNNEGLNRINNYRMSFDYNQYYGNLKKSIDQKIEEEKRLNLKKLTPTAISDLNKEYERITFQVSAPQYQRKLVKNQELIQQGKADTALMNKYRYKQASQQVQVNEELLKRLAEIEKLKALYISNSRSSELEAGVEEINSSTPSGFRNALKRYGMLKPQDNVLLTLRKFDLGTFDPDYNMLVISGVSLTGVNIEVNPGIVYGAFMYGTTVSNFSNPFSRDVSGGRTIAAGRFGIGKTTNLLIAGTILKGWDQSDNIVRDSNYTYYLPQNNYVVGIDVRYRIDRRVDVGLEYSSTLNEAQTKDLQTNGEQFSSVLPGSKNQYTHAWAGYAKMTLKESGTNIQFLTKLVDPFYYSFGTPYLRKDNFRVETKVEQPLWKKQLVAGVTYRRDQDNIYGLKEATFFNNMFLFTLNIRMSKCPYVVLIYSPNYQSYFNSLSKRQLSSSVKLYSITSGYTKQTKKLAATTSVSYTKQYNESTASDLYLFHVDQYSVNENLYLIQPELRLNGTCSFIRPFHGGDTGQILVLTAGASKSLFKKRKVTINASYTYQKDFVNEQRNIIRAGTNFSLGFGISCGIKVERHFIRYFKMTGPGSDMNLGQISLIKTF